MINRTKFSFRIDRRKRTSYVRVSQVVPVHCGAQIQRPGLEHVAPLQHFEQTAKTSTNIRERTSEREQRGQ